MRFMMAIASLVLLAGPALAAGEHYGNARFGYWITIPAGFTCGPEADDGDGKSCRSTDGATELSFWGGYAGVVNNDGFAGEVAFDMDADRKDGLAITYEKVTPGWAVWSGTRRGLIIYERMIAGCGGSQYAAFQVSYPPAKRDAMKPVIVGLTASLRQATCGD